MAEDKIKVISQKSDISKIADAIRNKTGLNDKLTLSQMVTAVNSITGENSIIPTISENGNWFINEVDTGKPSQGVGINAIEIEEV